MSPDQDHLGEGEPNDLPVPRSTASLSSIERPGRHRQSSAGAIWLRGWSREVARDAWSSDPRAASGG